MQKISKLLIVVFSILTISNDAFSIQPGWIKDRISFGNKIESAACPKDASGVALVVIDMQSYFVTRRKTHGSSANQDKMNNLINKQLEAIEIAIKARTPIIFIEYYDVNSITNDILKDAVKDYNQAHYIQKNADGMLDSKNPFREDLVDFLKYSKIKTLVITGANGGACVKQSILGALENNCNVVAYSEGIADFNYDDFIYPFIGYKKNLDYNCKQCSLQETSNLDEVFEILNRN